MNFRERHPQLEKWPKAALDRLTVNFPYSHNVIGNLLEVSSFDDSTHFFLFPLGFVDGERCGRFYGIEAPVNCNIRRQFEKGLIKWSDYWRHTGWLIELTFELGSDHDVSVCYKSFDQSDVRFLAMIQKLDQLGGPYKIYHDNLVGLCNIEDARGIAGTKYRDRYFEFVTKYSDIIKFSCDIQTRHLDIENLNLIRNSA